MECINDGRHRIERRRQANAFVILQDDLKAECGAIRSELYHVLAVAEHVVEKSRELAEVQTIQRVCAINNDLQAPARRN